MFSQVAMYAESYFAVMTLKGARVISAGCPKSHVHVNLVKMADRALMFLQVAIGPEGDCTGVTAKRPFHVVNVHVQT